MAVGEISFLARAGLVLGYLMVLLFNSPKFGVLHQLA